MVSNPTVVGALLETFQSEISRLNFRLCYIEEYLSTGFASLSKDIKPPESKKLWDILIEVAKKEAANKAEVAEANQESGEKQDD